MCRDPSPTARSALSLSWHPAGDSRLAVAYANRRYGTDGNAVSGAPSVSNNQLQSHIWNWTRPDAPELDLLPKSPLRAIAYNPTAPSVLAGGTAAGTLGPYALLLTWYKQTHLTCMFPSAALFDVKAGSHPTASTHLEHAHQDSVSDVIWVSSPSGAYCFDEISVPLPFLADACGFQVGCAHRSRLMARCAGGMHDASMSLWTASPWRHRCRRIESWAPAWEWTTPSPLAVAGRLLVGRRNFRSASAGGPAVVEITLLHTRRQWCRYRPRQRPLALALQGLPRH